MEQDLTDAGNDDEETTETPPQTALAELRMRIRSLSPKKRLDAILDCPDVLRVIRSFPIQDLYALVRDVGPGDCLELIELLHPRQIQGFMDLDGWRHDRVDSLAMGEWLEVMFAADPLRATAQMRGLDVELLTLLLKVHCRVYDLIEEEEPEGDIGLHTITPDQRLLVVFDENSGNAKLVQGLKSTVDLLFARDAPYIMRLLTAVRWELPSALEEEAYRWRNARLADLGFPEPTLAHEIFAWLDPSGTREVVLEPSRPVEIEDAEYGSNNLSASALLPWSLLDDGSTLLGGALTHVSALVRERVSHELMLTANHVHLALGGDLGDPGALRDSVKRVGDTVGIALSYLSHGDEQQTPALLITHPVRDLFRRGHSLGLRLRRELKVLMQDERSGLVGDALSRLDAPLREVVAGLLRKRPLFFEGLTDAARVEFRHFSSLPEVAESARALTEAAFRAALLGEHGLGYTDQALKELGVIDPANVPPLGVLLGTALSTVILDRGELKARGPLSDAEASDLAAVFRGEDGARTLPDDVQARVLDHVTKLAQGALPMPAAQDATIAAERAEAYARVVMRALEAEIGAIVGEVEARHLTTVWTEAASS